MALSKLALLALSSWVSFAVAQNKSTCSWTSAGCFNDPGTTRPLGVSVVPSATEDTTQENCQAACAARNYPYAGVENGYECWCGNIVTGTAVSQADSYCNIGCFGNTNQTCGGYSAMGVFHNSCVVPVLTVTQTVTSGIPPPTPTPTITWSTFTVTKTITPVPTPTPGPVLCTTYLCCVYYPQYCDGYVLASLSSAEAAATAKAKRWFF